METFSNSEIWRICVGCGIFGIEKIYVCVMCKIFLFIFLTSNSPLFRRQWVRYLRSIYVVKSLALFFSQKTTSVLNWSCLKMISKMFTAYPSLKFVYIRHQLSPEFQNDLLISCYQILMKLFWWSFTWITTMNKNLIQKCFSPRTCIHI